MVKLYTKYHINICKQDQKKCVKLIICVNFLSPRAITQQKINRPKQNSNLICNLSWLSYIPNQYLQARRKKVRKTDLPDWRTECKPKVPFDFVGRGLKIIRPEQNSNLNCNSSRYSHIPNIKSIYQRTSKKSPENLKFEQKIQVQGP